MSNPRDPMARDVKTDWIAVEDQLPEPHEWVVVADRFGLKGYAQYHNHDYPDFCNFEFIEYTDLLEAADITHWLRIAPHPNE